MLIYICKTKFEYMGDVKMKRRTSIIFGKKASAILGKHERIKTDRIYMQMFAGDFKKRSF